MDRQAHRGQGRFQLVGDRGDQAGLYLIQAAQTGDVRQHQGHPHQAALLIEDGHPLRQEETLLFSDKDLNGGIITLGMDRPLRLANLQKQLVELIVARLG